MMNMEKQEVESQLIIAGKLAEIGEMSTSIAHEINNPLQVMKSEVAMVSEVFSETKELLEAKAPENFELLKDSVNQIGIQIERCGSITKGLLDFARETEKTLKPIKIQKFLPGFIDGIKKRTNIENIKITQKIESDLPVLITDPNQLQQVFMNLFNNAIYALNDNESGGIHVAAFQKNSELIITIADNGCGFTEEDKDKAFMPFFTTKPVGKGTGLGLSSVYGIIKGLGGEISLESTLGAGSGFTIRLPFEPPEKYEKY
jgi:two-component system NtrC family sensor kinase